MTTWHVPRIVGTRVVVRPVHESDKARRLNIPSYPELARLYGGNPDSESPTHLTQAEVDSWFLRNSPQPEEIRWVIETDGRLTGGIRLHGIDEDAGVASLALGIYEPANWGLGYGPEAIELALAHAFDTMGLHRVELIVLETNKRAIRAYEKCGFTHEGRLRERAHIGGARVSDLIMGILKSEYRQWVEQRLR